MNTVTSHTVRPGAVDRARRLDVSDVESPMAELAVVRRARRLPSGSELVVVGLDDVGQKALRTWALTCGHQLREQDGTLRLTLGRTSSPPAWWQR